MNAANPGVTKRFQNDSNFEPFGKKTTPGGRAFSFLAKKALIENVKKGSLLVISTEDGPSTPDHFGNADGMVVYGVEDKHGNDMMVRFIGLYKAAEGDIKDRDVFNDDMRGKVLVDAEGLTHVLTPVLDGSLSDAVQEDIKKKSEDVQAQKKQKTGSNEGEPEKMDVEGGGAELKPDNRKFLLDLDNNKHYVMNKNSNVEIKDYYAILRLADAERVAGYCGITLLPFDVDHFKNIVEGKYAELAGMDTTDVWASVAKIVSLRETRLMRDDDTLGQFMRLEFDRWNMTKLTLLDFLRPEERVTVWPPNQKLVDTSFLEKALTAFKNLEKALCALFSKAYNGVFGDAIARLEDPVVRRELKMLSQAYVLYLLQSPLYKMAHEAKTVFKPDGSWKGAEVWALRLKNAYKESNIPLGHHALADQKEFYEYVWPKVKIQEVKAEKTVDAEPKTPTLSNSQKKRIKQQQQQKAQAQIKASTVVTPSSTTAINTPNGNSNAPVGGSQGNKKVLKICVYDLSFKLKLKNEECKNGAACAFEHRALGDITKEEAKTACKVVMKSQTLRDKHDAAIEASTEFKD